MARPQRIEYAGALYHLTARRKWGQIYLTVIKTTNGYDE